MIHEVAYKYDIISKHGIASAAILNKKIVLYSYLGETLFNTGITFMLNVLKPFA
jgi:hypothetical protein